MKNQNILLAVSVLILAGGLLNAAPEGIEVTQPEAIVTVEPEVPVNYLRWGITGEVVVTFQINDEGRPEHIELESYDDRIYGKNVKDAVRQWRFKAPQVKGVTYRMPVKFG